MGTNDTNLKYILGTHAIHTTMLPASKFWPTSPTPSFQPMPKFYGPMPPTPNFQPKPHMPFFDPCQNFTDPPHPCQSLTHANHKPTLPTPPTPPRLFSDSKKVALNVLGTLQNNFHESLIFLKSYNSMNWVLRKSKFAV